MQSTRTILVIDDDAALADLVVEVLTDEGYIAYTVPDGTAALATIARQPPALIVLDVRMPDMSGAELIAHLRATGLAAMPIVLLTASPQDAAPLLMSGAIECLTKPFDIEDLVACVARFVKPSAAVAKHLCIKTPVHHCGARDN
jgi:DNA-binding response OmpR family regulator